MTNMKKLCKKATRFNKREVSNTKSVERKFTKQISKYQTSCAKMGRIIETTSREIKEEQAEIFRMKEEQERQAKEDEEIRVAKKQEEVRKLREKLQW